MSCAKPRGYYLPMIHSSHANEIMHYVDWVVENDLDQFYDILSDAEICMCSTCILVYDHCILVDCYRNGDMELED